MQHDRSFDETHLIFSGENGGLADHPIVEGRDASEKVRRVLTFTGEAYKRTGCDGRGSRAGPCTRRQ